MSPLRRNWNFDDPSLSPPLCLPSEEKWPRYRRDVLEHPRSLYNPWFSTNLAAIRAGTVQLQSSPRPYEVHCRLYATCIEVPPNGTCFVDPATFTLFISAEIPSHVPQRRFGGSCSHGPGSNAHDLDGDYNGGTGGSVFGGSFEYTEVDFGPEDFM